MAARKDRLVGIAPPAAPAIGPLKLADEPIPSPEPSTGSVVSSFSSVKDRVESFGFRGTQQVLVRTVTRRDGTRVDSEVPVGELCVADCDLSAAFDSAWLRQVQKPELQDWSEEIRLVDLFSGCGGMTVGVSEACRALGFRAQPLLAVDIDTAALSVYERNIPVVRTTSDPIESILDSSWGEVLSSREEALKKELGRVDIVVGGPPCQGHSDLNNHTRRNDPKNELYLKMARIAEVCEPDHIVIENVRGVRYDNGKVYERTWQRLEELGYSVDGAELRAEVVGVPQSRPRVLLVASKKVSVTIEEIAAQYRTNLRSFMWACGDLVVSRTGPFDTPSVPKAITKARIDYLFDNDSYELPDHMRPLCHQNGHTYPSVYGRIHPDRPAPTITTGFMTMGRGRFTHPTERRTLTLHEGARIQCFPDWFHFDGNLTRAECITLIGNAVPPKLAYVLALELLR